MEQKIEDMDFKDLDAKFAKRKFNRSNVVVNINPQDFVKLFINLHPQYYFSVPKNNENRLLYTNQDMNQMNKTRFDAKDLAPVDVFRSALFIIAKLGYSPFKKFHYIFIKDLEKENKTIYFDVSVFARQNLNFFNYILAPDICSYLKNTEPNNFYIRLQNCGLKVTKGKEFLFNKSYMTSNNKDEILTLSSNISQLRNFLFAVENHNDNLLNKIDLKGFNRKFIDFELNESK